MILRRLFLEGARRLAANPALRRKAVDTAETVYRRAAPKVENAGRHLAESFRDTEAEGNPLDDPIGFAKRFKNKLLPPEE